MLVLRRGRDVLLEKRPSPGIWGGLWCLPQFESAADARRWSAQVGVEWKQRQALKLIEHGFTHYKLTIHPIVLNVGHAAAGRTRRRLPEPAPEAAMAEARGRLWMDLAEAAQAALPAPVKKLLLGLVL